MHKSCAMMMVTGFTPSSIELINEYKRFSYKFKIAVMSYLGDVESAVQNSSKEYSIGSLIPTVMSNIYVFLIWMDDICNSLCIIWVSNRIWNIFLDVKN